MKMLNVVGLPEDKVKHLQKLIKSWQPKKPQSAPQMEKDVNSLADASDQAWQEFFQIGDTLAECDTPDVETLTSAVLSMRGIRKLRYSSIT